MELEQEKAAILKSYETSLQAHIQQDARAFLAEYASQWYDVRNAGVRLRTQEEAAPRIGQYFKTTSFQEISQIAPPVIHVSQDASMAWMIGHISVRATRIQPDGTEQDFSFRCAWVSIFEKSGNEWAQVVDAPSFQFKKDGD